MTGVAPDRESPQDDPRRPPRGHTRTTPEHSDQTDGSGAPRDEDPPASVYGQPRASLGEILVRFIPLAESLNGGYQ